MLTADGPKRMAPNPVPVMWEQLPVTDGIFSEEITNTKAPAIARSGSSRELAATVFFHGEKACCQERNTQDTPGDTVGAGKISLHDMHGADCGSNSEVKAKIVIAIQSFLFLVIFSSPFFK